MNRGDVLGTYEWQAIFQTLPVLQKFFGGDPDAGAVRDGDAGRVTGRFDAIIRSRGMLFDEKGGAYSTDSSPFRSP
jgi:hypothetical protein